MKRYKITLTGLTPLLMHADNIIWGERIKKWRDDPANKTHSVRGDDRSPAWTWLSYLYHDGKTVGLPADNLMTMLREGGAKVSTGKGKETYKKRAPAGLMSDTQQFALLTHGAEVNARQFNDLIGEHDFTKHVDAVEAAGFELLVKRAKIGKAKHVRVRPMFREWAAVGTVTVMDEDTSGLTHQVLDTILRQAGALVGLCDWRPASPQSSGTFGKFAPEIEPL